MSANSQHRKILREAFLDSIDIMGERGKTVFVENLQRRGLDIYDDNLSRIELASAIQDLFGESVANTIMRRIESRLDD